MAQRNQLVGDASLSLLGSSVSRREMLRRLTLLGIAAGASGPLLAACGGTGPQAAAAPPPGREPGTPLGSPITFAGPAGELHGAWATPAAAPRAAVLVVPDAKGLTPHYTDLVGRFAGAGYATLCPDLLSGSATPNRAPANPAVAQPEPGTPADAHPASEGNAQPAPASTPATPEQQVADLRAAIDELARRAPGVKVGAVGFGKGGGLLWQLLGAGEPRISAAVPFYGMASDDLDFSKSPAAVLGIYPDNDSKLNESQDNADMAMMKANLVHNSTIYPGSAAGFFDDTGAGYNPDAAAKAWGATLDWFKQYL